MTEPTTPAPSPLAEATGSVSMARALITDKLLRWKSALEASHESAPGSTAAVWVEGYIYGLQQALDYLPNTATNKNTMQKQTKSYEVTVTAYATVLVIEAENSGKAIEYAIDRLSFGDLTMEEAEVTREITTEEELETCRQHADVIADDE